MKLKIIVPLLLSLYLGLQNGYLALWETGAQEPMTVFPYHCRVYPKIDQTQLKKGIPISSQDQLKALLADFLS